LRKTQSISLENIIKVFLQFHIYLVTATKEETERERLHGAAEFLKRRYTEELRGL
jgi:hypothetical protein